MDDLQKSRGDQNPSSPTAQWQQGGGTVSPAGFVPMGLVLVPTGMRVDVTKAEAVVGRHTDADVRLPLPDVSRKHCRFVFADGRWHVLDLNSTNGVYVNNKRVDQAGLNHRDRVKIGGFTFEVDLPPAKPVEKRPKPSADGETGIVQMPRPGDGGRRKAS
jgi:hypothetical protein